MPPPAGGRGRRRVASPTGVDVRSFPEFVLGGGTVVHRMHLEGNGPWWFSSDGSQRFDLRRPNGTCYVAERPMGAFVEVAARFHVVKRAELDERRMAEITIDQALRLADCLAARAAGFGVKAEVSAGYPYETASHPWSRLFWRAGFDGVRYGAGHDPALSEVCFALFGAAGATTGYGSWTSRPIQDSLAAEAVRV
ncbi:MAG TPA: RES family NAD+ phosphorylase [Acidimicrobiales bacterium]|nr:RES family NAD+ phosphorylase [Acidimicrobiales bacterium]